MHALETIDGAWSSCSSLSYASTFSNQGRLHKSFLPSRNVMGSFFLSPLFTSSLLLLLLPYLLPPPIFLSFSCLSPPLLTRPFFEGQKGKMSKGRVVITGLVLLMMPLDVWDGKCLKSKFFLHRILSCAQWRAPSLGTSPEILLTRTQYSNPPRRAPRVPSVPGCTCSIASAGIPLPFCSGLPEKDFLKSLLGTISDHSQCREKDIMNSPVLIIQLQQ